MVKSPVSLAFLLLLTFLLSGCWDVKQADEIMYVSAIGLDDADDGKIKITYLIINPEYGTQPNSSTDTEPFNYVTFVADDLYIAKSMINTIMSNSISYVLLNQIFVSEKLAKKEKFIHWIYDATKLTEIRRDINLVVTKEEAEAYLAKFNPKIEKRPIKYFPEKAEINELSGLVPYNTEIFYYFRVTELNNDLFLSIYSSNDEKLQTSSHTEPYSSEILKLKGNIDFTQFLGAAVFKKGKMIGTLNGLETMLVSMLHTNYQGKEYFVRSFRDPFDEKLPLTVRLNIIDRTKIKLDIHKKNPSIHVTLPIKVDVFTNHSMVNYAWNMENRKKLKDHLEKELEKQYESLLKKTQEEFGADPFDWSIIARRQFTTIDAFESYDWMKKYSQADISIDINLRFGDFGRQSEVINLKRLQE